MSKEAKKILGIDWGEKRIGVAIGDSETRTATPLQVVSNIDDLIDIIKREDIEIVVVGMPKKLDDKESISSKNTLNFIEKLEEKLEIPIETVDERLTSKAVDSLDGDKKNKAPRDAMAAMLILQTYIDRLD